MTTYSTSSAPHVGVAEEKSQRKPVVFMFQPTEFVPVQPDKLKEWEEGLRSSLGANADWMHKLLITAGGHETTSICPGAGADDCDYHEHDPVV